MFDLQPLTLTTICRLTAAKSVFERLMKEKDLRRIHVLLSTFITTDCIPKPMIAGIVRALMVTLDRGHSCLKRNRFDFKASECSDCVNPLVKDHSCSSHRRFRALALARHCVQIVMCQCRDENFSPVKYFIDDSLPLGLTMRMRQWIVMYAVDAFLMIHEIAKPTFPTKSFEPSDVVDWNDGPSFSRANCERRSLENHQTELILKEYANQFCRKLDCLQTASKHPMKVLDLRKTSGNVNCLRATLAALKLRLESSGNECEWNGQKCTNINKPLGGITPTIKLEVALDGTLHKAVSESLLSVLQNSKRQNLHVNLTSIRFEDVNAGSIQQILRSLPNPGEVQQLHYRHVTPVDFFEAKDALRLATGVEEFSFSCCAVQAAILTINETQNLWNDVFRHWPKLRWLEFSRVRFRFPNESQIVDPAYQISIPQTVHSIEFADDSLTADVLSWLTGQLIKSCLQLRSIRFVRENGLTNKVGLWKAFQSLVRYSSRLKSFSVDHCGLRDSHFDKLSDYLNSQKSASPSKMQQVTIREPYSTWAATCKFFSKLLNSKVSSSGRTEFHHPHLNYFSSNGPKQSEIEQLCPAGTTSFNDVEILARTQKHFQQGNPCSSFEKELHLIAEKYGRNITIDLLWEPDCDWT